TSRHGPSNTISSGPHERGNQKSRAPARSSVPARKAICEVASEAAAPSRGPARLTRQESCPIVANEKRRTAAVLAPPPLSALAPLVAALPPSLALAPWRARSPVRADVLSSPVSRFALP